MMMKQFKNFKATAKKILLFAYLLLFTTIVNAQTTTVNTNSQSYGTFKKLFPYISGIIAIMVFIAAVRGIVRILRSDPEGKTDLMYAGLGAGAWVGLEVAINSL